MLVTLRWWQIWDVADKIIMLVTFFVTLVIFSIYLIGYQHLKIVLNSICLQHPSPTSISPYINIYSFPLDFTSEISKILKGMMKYIAQFTSHTRRSDFITLSFFRTRQLQVIWIILYFSYPLVRNGYFWCENHKNRQKLSNDL